MLSFCRQARVLHWLLLVFMALQLGPQGAVACLRADGNRSYGADCSCTECKQPSENDRCGCGSGQSCHNGDAPDACSSATTSAGVTIPAAQHAGRDADDTHVCCADHQLPFQHCNLAQAPQRAAPELIIEPLPIDLASHEALEASTAELLRPKAPPGWRSPDRPGLLNLRI